MPSPDFDRRIQQYLANQDAEKRRLLDNQLSQATSWEHQEALKNQQRQDDLRRKQIDAVLMARAWSQQLELEHGMHYLSRTFSLPPFVEQVIPGEGTPYYGELIYILPLRRKTGRTYVETGKQIYKGMRPSNQEYVGDVEVYEPEYKFSAPMELTDVFCLRTQANQQKFEAQAVIKRWHIQEHKLLWGNIYTQRDVREGGYASDVYHYPHLHIPTEYISANQSPEEMQNSVNKLFAFSIQLLNLDKNAAD